MNLKRPINLMFRSPNYFFVVIGDLNERAEKKTLIVVDPWQLHATPHLMIHSEHRGCFDLQCVYRHEAEEGPIMPMEQLHNLATERLSDEAVAAHNPGRSAGPALTQKTIEQNSVYHQFHCMSDPNLHYKADDGSSTFMHKVSAHLQATYDAAQHKLNALGVAPKPALIVREEDED